MLKFRTSQIPFIVVMLMTFNLWGQSNSTVQDGNWLVNNRWDTSPYPSASNCYTTITISNTIGIQNSQSVDLSSCGAVDIIIDGGQLRFGQSGTIGATMNLASGSTITLTNGASISQVGSGENPSTTKIIINGTIVWDGSDPDITGEGVIDENSVNGSLPVELISFYGKSNSDHALLYWETSSESNNEGFQVEMSSNSIDFQSIGWVNGFGNTNETHLYEFSIGGLNNKYFRLKQVDFDGQFEYSPTIFVYVNEETKIQVYPNPTQGQIKLSGDVNTTYNASLMNTLGEVILNEKSIELSRFEDQLNAKIPDLNSGFYYIKLVNRSNLTTLRLLIE